MPANIKTSARYVSFKYLFTNYIATIIMVDNWLPNFDMNEQRKIDKHIPENLSKIKTEIGEKKQWVEPASRTARKRRSGSQNWKTIRSCLVGN